MATQCAWLRNSVPLGPFSGARIILLIYRAKMHHSQRQRQDKTNGAARQRHGQRYPARPIKPLPRDAFVHESPSRAPAGGFEAVPDSVAECIPRSISLVGIQDADAGRNGMQAASCTTRDSCPSRKKDALIRNDGGPTKVKSQPIEIDSHAGGYTATRIQQCGRNIITGYRRATSPKTKSLHGARGQQAGAHA